MPHRLAAGVGVEVRLDARILRGEDPLARGGRGRGGGPGPGPRPARVAGREHADAGERVELREPGEGAVDLALGHGDPLADRDRRGVVREPDDHELGELALHAWPPANRPT